MTFEDNENGSHACILVKLHRYPTRCKNTPNIQRHKSETFNRSFLCKSIVEFKGLFSELTNSKSDKHLIKAMKKHLQET